MKTSQEVLVTSDASGDPWSAAVWDPTTGSRLATYADASAALGHGTPLIVGETYLVGTDATKPRLRVWNLNSRTPVANLRPTTAGRVSAMACTRDGSYAVLGIGEKIFIWQLTTGKLLAALARHYRSITCLRFAEPEGGNFASGGEDGLVFVWSLARAASANRGGSRDRVCSPVHAFSDHTLPVKDLHYGNFAANSRLVSVSLDRTTRIYDGNAGVLLLTVVFDVPLTSVAVDVRESRLFIGASNGLVMRFDLRDPPRGSEHHVSSRGVTDGSAVEKFDGDAYRGHEGSVTCLSVSVDCRTLASGSVDGRVRLWDIVGRQVIRTIAHKGPIASVRFVPAYENFRAASLRPKLRMRPMKRFADEGAGTDGDDFIDIIGSRDDSELLNFKNYREAERDSTPESPDDADCELAEARKEIDRLRRKNSELYEYAVKALAARASLKKTK